MPSAPKSAELKAVYTSPTGTHEFASTLPHIDRATHSTSNKTAYLADLRCKTSKLQDEVNTFLTSKMEEDKLAATGVANSKVDEDKEEANYGEEDPEQEG